MQIIFTAGIRKVSYEEEDVFLAQITVGLECSRLINIESVLV